MSQFEESIKEGIHADLQALKGKWEGMTKTWFEPDKLADESPMTAEIEPILGGRFLSYVYHGSLQGNPFEGLAIIGYSFAESRFEIAWIDEFHMGTGIMFSVGEKNSDVLRVLGSYGAPGSDERWGWSTELTLNAHDELVVTAYNITPDGVQAKATETIFRKV